MISETVLELLNNQINKEFFSEFLYLDISNYFDAIGLTGFSNWFFVQAQEERDHALLFVKYMQNNSLKITYDTIENPTRTYETSMDPLKYSLEHEQYVTSLIHNIYDKAYSEKDFRTMQFLDWFVKEQGEEETNATDLITKMELYGSDSKGLYMLDQELAGRIYSAPSLVL